MTLTCFYHLPKYGIVKIVDMTVDLPPPEVVLYTGLIGICHDSAVEGRNLLKRNVEIFTPVENIC